MEQINADAILWAAVAAGALASVVTLLSYRGALMALISAYRAAHLRRVGDLLASMLSNTTAEEFWRRQLIYAAIGFLVFALLGGGGLAAFVGAALGYVLPLIKLRNDADLRRIQFEGQLEDALISMSNTLKTSPRIEDAIELVKKALPPPASEEFSLVALEIQASDKDRALERFGRRMKSRDLDAVLSAIKISEAAGANLSEMLYNIATTLREVKRLQGLIESKTAEGKMQARVMGALPVLLGIALFFIQPKMITPLFTTNLGLAILAVVIILEITGIYLIQRISRLDI